jgi:hypothetical protein
MTEQWVKEYWAETRLPVSVQISGANEFSNYDWYPDFFVQSQLHDVFVASNLALPGAADFLAVGLESRVAGRPHDRLELSAFYFEQVFREANRWPKLERLGVLKRRTAKR